MLHVYGNIFSSYRTQAYGLQPEERIFCCSGWRAAVNVLSSISQRPLPGFHPQIVESVLLKIACPPVSRMIRVPSSTGLLACTESSRCIIIRNYRELFGLACDFAVTILVRSLA